MTEQGELTSIGEVLHEIKAIVKYLFVLETESFRDPIDGMFRPTYSKRRYMSTLELMRSRIR